MKGAALPPVDQVGPGQPALMWWVRGQELLLSGRFKDALPFFLRVVAIEANNVAAWIQLAQVQQRCGCYRDSHASTIAAARLGPASHEHAVPLARLLRSFEESAYLDALFRHGLWQSWKRADDVFELARQFATLGMHEQAAVLLDAISRLQPSHLNSEYLRGAIHMFEGRQEQARVAFQRCLSIAPALPQAHWMMSLLQKQVAFPEEASTLRKLLQQAWDQPRDAAYLAYALHNRLHSLKAFPDAWSALEHGWAAKRRIKTYDRSAQVRLFGSLKTAFTPEFMSQEPRVDAAPSKPRVVFIVGLHRSGTSLLERMLGGHPDIAEGGESYAFPVCLKLAADYPTRDLIDETLVARSASVDYAEVAERFRGIMQWRSKGREFITEKLPANFILLGHILRALPDALVLHMRRDPMDTCFSNLRTYFDEAAPYATDQLDMAHYHRQYRELMAHWHAVAPGRILDVDYSRLVSQPRETIRNVLDHCGLTFDERVVRIEREDGTIRTASMVDARLGIRTDRADAWMPYAVQLAPLRAALTSAG